MIYITGDKVRDLSHIENFSKQFKTTINDIMIILGSNSINFYLNECDDLLKERLSKIPLTFFCIEGCYDKKYNNFKEFNEKEFHGGKVYYQNKYLNILYAKDIEVYNFYNKKFLTITDASVPDKFTKMMLNIKRTNKVSDLKIDKINFALINHNYNIDVILSHSVPYKYLCTIEEIKDEYKLEKFLDEVEENVDYKIWYTPYFHINKKIYKIRFIFDDVDELL